MELHFIVVIVCALAVPLQACALMGIETCGFGASRCHGNTVQVCKTGLGWTDSASCEDIAAAEGGQWTCATPKGICSEVHQCMPVPSKVDSKSTPDAGDTSDKPAKRYDKEDKTRKTEKKKE